MDLIILASGLEGVWIASGINLERISADALRLRQRLLAGREHFQDRFRIKNASAPRPAADVLQRGPKARVKSGLAWPRARTYSETGPD